MTQNEDTKDLTEVLQFKCINFAPAQKMLDDFMNDIHFHLTDLAKCKSKCYGCKNPYDLLCEFYQKPANSN